MIDERYRKYTAEMKELSHPEIMSPDVFQRFSEDALEGAQSIRIAEDENRGILYYRCWEENDTLHCSVPVFGYYANNVKTLVMLFQRLAAAVVSDRKCVFSVFLYAHDYESIHAFHLMQFGIICEKGIARVSGGVPTAPNGIRIRELSKPEIRSAWDGIWNMTGCIIRHLQESPIFYPGEEFTEEVYQAFFTDSGTTLFAAYDDRQLIGMIALNSEEAPLACGANRSMNVGEIYVLPEYRKKGVSTALLEAAADKAAGLGAEYLWVEHGTANPNARGFWNAHFETYQYELIRTIER